jgi:ribosomal protein S14
MLKPVYDFCPPGKWINACLEACHRDPTTCTLYQGVMPTAKERFVEPSKPSKSPIKQTYRCRVCGETDPGKFYRTPTTICAIHHNEYRRNWYEKNKLPKTRYQITRPCQRCGIQFQRWDNERFKYCEKCREVPQWKR